MFVRYDVNMALGVRVTKLEVGASLSAGLHPEQQEPLRLIGTLVEKPRLPWSAAKTS